MPSIQLIVLVLSAMVASRLLRGLMWLVVWIAGAAAAILVWQAFAPAPAHAANDDAVVWSKLVVESAETASGALNQVVWDDDVLLCLPAGLPPGSQLWLAGSADGNAPLQDDDVLDGVVRIGVGPEIVIHHDFRRPDHTATEPWPPLQVGPVPSEAVAVDIHLWITDLQPPRAFRGAIFAVIRAQQIEAPATATRVAASWGSVIAPSLTATPRTTATPRPLVPTSTPVVARSLSTSTALPSANRGQEGGGSSEPATPESATGETPSGAGPPDTVPVDVDGLALARAALLLVGVSFGLIGLGTVLVRLGRRVLLGAASRGRSF